MTTVTPPQPLSPADAQTTGLELVHEHSDRFIAMCRSLDAGELARPVHGGGWTVGDTITHVESVYLRYSRDPRRADTPQGVAVQNADDLERMPVDVERSAATMLDQLAFLDGVVPAVDPATEFPFHARRTTTMAGGMGNLIGELLAHGDDIARATGRSFTIPSAHTEVLWRYTAPLLDGWLRPETVGVADTWRVHFPFGPIDAAFDGGRLHWAVESIATPDHEITAADAAEFALAFPYRRRVIADPQLALLASRFYDV
jgi:hypothetical protein